MSFHEGRVCHNAKRAFNLSLSFKNDSFIRRSRPTPEVSRIGLNAWLAAARGQYLNRMHPSLQELRPFCDSHLDAPQSKSMSAFCVEVHLYRDTSFLER